MSNPYQKYIDQSVSTMTQGEMVVRLFEEIVNQLSRACIFMDEKKIGETNEALLKAQRIVNHLLATLDDQYEISKNLSSLYLFFNDQIIRGNMKKEKNYIEDILPMVIELKDTFAQCEKMSRMK